MSEEKKTDEQAAATFLRSLGLGRGVERGEDSGKVRATVALIQAVRAERDAELATMTAIAEDAIEVAGEYNAQYGDEYISKKYGWPANYASLRDRLAATKAAPPPPRAEPPKSEETQETKACPECRGTGEVEHRETGGHSCWPCQRSGHVAVEKSRSCDHCGGDGGNLETGTAFFGSGPDCPTCLGTGRIPTSGAAGKSVGPTPERKAELWRIIDREGRAGGNAAMLRAALYELNSEDGERG